MTTTRGFLVGWVTVLSCLANGILLHAEEYEPQWKSLAKHQQAPEWFRDAKFGIYFHWGPYAVPAFGNEHYPRTMYGHISGKKPKPKKAATKGIGFQTYREHEFHIRAYGQPKAFEYHDLFPLFTAQSFNAEEWADLFFLAGAKFAGPVAMHHDGFAMWDSAVTPWNSMAIGPQRDIVGEIARAIRKRHMKFITTFHHAKVGRAAESDPENIAGIISEGRSTLSGKLLRKLIVMTNRFGNSMAPCHGPSFSRCGRRCCRKLLVSMSLT